MIYEVIIPTLPKNTSFQLSSKYNHFQGGWITCLYYLSANKKSDCICICWQKYVKAKKLA